MLVFALFDQVAEFFHPPITHVNGGVALRTLKDAMMADPRLQENAGDYDLYEIGEFDEQKGVLTPTEPRKLVLNLAQLIDKD